MSNTLLPQIRIQSYNPYESRYPGRRVVSRDTLHLIKLLRETGYPVTVEPDDGTKLNYTTEKGLRELLTDPVFALVVGIPIGIIVNIFSSWLYDKFKRKPTNEEVNIVLELDEDGKRLRYSHSGKPISEKRFQSLLKVMERRAQRYQEAQAITPPNPARPTPVFLEHTDKIVGWGFVSLDDKGLKINDLNITDKRTLKRVEKGSLQGASIAGLIYSSTCSICANDYVDCNHIASREYNGSQCVVHIDGIDLAEISLVRKPIQPLAKIEVIKGSRKDLRKR